MTATTTAPPRIVTLDIVRGVAVMGILAMNIIAFSMPFQAYMNPAAFGMDDAADFASWLFSFVFIDGKMRGLFSFLFGASMLLVVQRADARVEKAAAVHYRRMAWLLVFGMLHLYLIWFGDILTLYALVGMIAWRFREMEPDRLIRWGVILITVQLIIFAALAGSAFTLSQAAAAANAPAEIVDQWRDFEANFGVLSGQPLSDKLALFRGSYAGIVETRLADHALSPLTSLLMLGPETLGYFLFGMAALKAGFLTGGWPTAAYRKWATVGLSLSVPAYAVLAWLVVRDGFSVPMVLATVMAATIPFRPLMVLAYAALIILVTRRGGWLAERIAAAGRAAFTNYLGTSILMTALFYGWGLGLYGRLDRAELWIVVFAAWAVMLAWSKPWLERFNYGPFEWLWRSLARWKAQPLRKSRSDAVAAGA